MAAGSAASAIYYGAMVAAAAGGVAQGHEASRAARSGRKRQGEAQQRAEAQAVSQQRENQTAQNRANRKKPNIGAILAANQAGGGGINSTLLSGVGGVSNSGLSLGTTRLGE